MARSLPFLLLMLICMAMVDCCQPNEPRQLNQINKNIWKYSRKYHEPTFEITKLAYTNLTKLGSKQIYECLNKQTESRSRHSIFQILPSITIHEGDHNTFPAIVRLCEQYYSVNGYKLANFQSKNTFNPNPHSNATPNRYQHFVSSVRNQFTYFAEVQWVEPTSKDQMTGSRISIKKLQQKNKKINLQQQLTLNLQPQYGEVTGFVNSFALSLKLFAFSTTKGYVIFYRMDGKIENIYHFGYHWESGRNKFTVKKGLMEEVSQNTSQIVLRLAKLNNHIAIYTQKLDTESFIYTIGTNSKNNTIKKFTIPKIQHVLQQSIIELKYSDNNWNQFFVKIGSKVYLYDQLNALPLSGHSIPQQTQFSNHPIHWFPLLDPNSQFFVAGSMLIVQPSKSEPSSIHPYRFYYNMSLNSGEPFQFRLPNNICKQSNRRPLMGISSQALGAHIVCLYCNYAYQCYSLSSSTNGLTNAKLDYTDYSKFRVPLVILSLGVVIFISVTRSKKNSGKSIEQQKQEEQFMKQLEKRDKSLYEELKRNKKGQSNIKPNNAPTESNRMGQPNKSKKANLKSQPNKPMFRQVI